MTQPTDPRPASPVGGEANDEAIRRLKVLLDQKRNGTPVSDPDEWEADELEEIIAALSAPSVTGEAVAWRYRLKSPSPGEYDGWVTTIDREYAEGWCVRMGYEVQPLYAAPVSAHEGSVRHALVYARAHVVSSPHSDRDQALEVIDKALAALSPTALEERCARMETALKPFADVLADVGEDEADADLYQAMSKAHRRAPAITVGHLRAARLALTKGKPHD